MRLRRVDRAGCGVLAEFRSGEGVREVNTRLVERGQAADPRARSSEFAEALSKAIRQLNMGGPVAAGVEPVIVSGMASATVGWKELPYAHVPCPLDGSQLTLAPVEPVSVDGREHPVWLVSGLRTESDILRGEETELLGVLNLPEFERFRNRALVVLPGTHSKHLRVVGGALVDFRTFMTGELLELLSTRSLLSVSVTWPPPAVAEAALGLEGRAAEDFRAGVQWVREAGLARALFRVRVRSVLQGSSTEANAWFLAGLMVGAELVELLPWDPEAPILLAASARFVPLYHAAADCLGAAGRLTTATPAQLQEATLRTHALLLERVWP